ncbi:MAG: WD40 repeat domain-containing protein, partial [Gemmataceae bacterium]
REGARLDDGIRKDSDLQKELRKRWQPPALLARYPYPATITALAFSPDGKTLVSSGHHELAVWDSQTGQLVKRVHIRARRAMSMVFLPDGKLVVAGGRPGEEGDVSVYNINANSGKKEQGVTILDGVNDKSVLISRLLEAEDEVLSVAISKDGKKLATGGCDRMVNVWDIGQGIEKAVMETPIENHADWVFSVQFSPDGKHLYTSSRDKTAKVWDLKAKESVLTFPDHQNTVYAVVPKADGKGGYSVGEDNQLRLWGNTGDQAGKQIKNVGAHGKAVLKVLAIAGQPLLATCGADGVVKVWNADSFAAVRTLENLGDQVYSLAVSPDQKWIAAGSFNGEVKIWKLADGGLIKGFNASPGLATAAKK